MVWDDFHSQFNGAINRKDIRSANKALMKEIGRILVVKKQDFVDLLNESEIPATADMTDYQLIELYTDNIDKKPKLMMGTSFLVNLHNRKMGFDGEEDMDDQSVKNGYAVLRNYYSGADGGILGAISGIAQSAGATANKVLEGQQKKKYGAQDLAMQKEASKQALIQSVTAGKQAAMESARLEAESKKKTNTIILISGGIALLVLVIVGIKMYKNKSK